MRLGAGGDESLRSRIRPRQAEHLMAGTDELRDNGRANESGGAGEEYAHLKISWDCPETDIGYAFIL
jgi:hypothetical protein